MRKRTGATHRTSWLRSSPCAFLGNPLPTVTLYKGDVNITANSKFWYNSTSGVCTIIIPTCTLKDSSEYSVPVENELGKDRSGCTLTVYDKDDKTILASVTESLQKKSKYYTLCELHPSPGIRML
ncbi:unnamed protein product [Pipistrellus nathusii]|uniref:Immunoglobulin I-set domain-containing protein n=1 Tax=Pipistrellus nathusii TaxID=59473 RepID=A0ABP0AFI4_PIPNA